MVVVCRMRRMAEPPGTNRPWTVSCHLWYTVNMQPSKSVWGPILALTLVIEAVTAFFRFGLGLESTRDTANSIGRLTLGLRIHHGYIGVVLLLIGWWLWRRGHPPITRWLFIIGGSLALSDLVHHFIVLWWATGSPEFDLFYPRS
jgi:hypothetical protein